MEYRNGIHIQTRYDLKDINSHLKEFSYRGEDFVIVGISEDYDLMPKNLPIGVVMTGFACQYNFQGKKNKIVTGQVMAYYYSPMEGGWVGILDTIKFNKVSEEEQIDGKN